MARETIIQQGGRPVMLRADVVSLIDALGEAVELMAAQGTRKGLPDRVGVIEAAVALVLEDAALRARLRDRLAPQVAEMRAREQAKAARRARSGGRVGRPPAASRVQDDASPPRR